MATAQELHEFIESLRKAVNEAWATEKWANDNQFAQSYQQLAMEAAKAFPDDELLGSLQVSVPKELDALIGKDPSCVTAWVRMQVDRLAIRLSQLARQEGAADRHLIDLDLDFLTDDTLRFIVASDFTEAQRAYYAGSPKACAVLCGSVIEGLLLDSLSREQFVSDGALSDLPRKTKSTDIDWDRATLAELLKAALGAKTIRDSTLKFAHSVRDFRNMLHPRAEARAGSRATIGEANMLIEIVKLLAEDLKMNLRLDSLNA